MFDKRVKMLNVNNNSNCYIFIRFPRNNIIRKLWLTACGLQEEELKKHYKLCSLHFEENCYKSGSVTRSLKPESVPTKLSNKTKRFFESYFYISYL